MKLISNGFNLYRQLGSQEYLIENFTPVFGGYAVEDFYINHTFSILKVGGTYKIVYKNGEKVVNGCGTIVKISSSDERIIVLNDEGKLFKIDLTDINITHEIPHVLNSESPEAKIVNISCGSKLSIAYSNKGDIFNIPERLNFSIENIVNIQCGKEHCLLLDNLGNVYTFGRGSRGQLGHGQLDDEIEPTRVECLGGIKITHIAAGGWHSCALSIDGDVYTWGWNGNGQLGLGKEEKDGETSVSVMASPHVVDLPDPEKNAMKIACGSRHTIVLLDNNQLVGCGWNKYKQLINIEKENFYSFTYLHDLSNKKILALKCGPWNSAVLTT